MLVTFFLILMSSRAEVSSQAQKIPDSFIQSLSQWIAIGEFQKKNGNFAAAAEAFQRAEAEAGWLGRDKDRIASRMALGVIYWDLGELGKSREYYEYAKSLAERTKSADDREKCQTALDIDRLYQKGKEFNASRNFSESIACFEQAVAHARKLGSLDHEAKCLRLMSIVYLDKSDFNSFLELNKRALRIYQIKNNNRESAYCLQNIGIYYRWKSDLPNAIKYILESLSIHQMFRLPADEADCLFLLGALFSDMGNFNKAIDYYLGAEKIRQRLSSFENRCAFYLNMGVLYRRRAEAFGSRRDLETALSYYDQALGIARQSDDKKEECLLLNNIGFALIKLGKFPDAFRMLQSGYAKALPLNDPELMLSLLSNLGHTLIAQGKIQEAMLSYEKAIYSWGQATKSQYGWEAYWGLGQCYEKLGKYKEAEALYKNSIALVKQTGDQLGLESDKTGFIRNKYIVHESLINLYYEQFRTHPDSAFLNKVFESIEKAKAQTFIENVQRSALPNEIQGTSRARRDEMTLSSRISSLMRVLSRSEAPAERMEDLWAELAQQEERYARLRESDMPRNRRGFCVDPVSVDRIRKFLNKRKSAVLEYFMGKDCSYLSFLSGSSFAVYPLPAKSVIEDSVKLYIKMISSFPRNNAFRIQSASSRLFRELLFPLDHLNPGEIESLVIVPDGLLYYLPFETLTRNVNQGSNPGRLLLEDFNVSYAPSATALVGISSSEHKGHANKDLLAVGSPIYGPAAPPGRALGQTPGGILREAFLDQGFSFCPLPFTRAEIQGITHPLRKDKVSVLLGAQASEEAIKTSNLTDYQAIHFACHSFLDERYPLRSSLVLSQNGEGNEDGFLQAREIGELRTNAELVVLSSCQTGRGCLEKGEGPLGLPRVFFYAGAKSVVSALWSINDESTSLFMKSFYAGLRRGLSKSRALRKAKLDMMKTKYSHPFYWAAFVLNGDYYSGVEFH